MFNIILAAGLSSRMGYNKLLLKYNNKSLIEHQIKASFEAKLDVIVVTGCFKDEIEKEIIKLKKKYKTNIYVAHNENYNYGQLSSLIVGVKKTLELKNDSPYFISVGDIPFLKKDDFLNLIPHLNNHDALRPFVNGTFGHPVLINNNISKEIIALDFKNKNEGLRSFLKKKDTIAFNSNNIAYIQDIDTKETYERLISSTSLE
ncbi:MAG: nucleotidyltransferase family protein [Pleomorphochaeta sp.]